MNFNSLFVSYKTFSFSGCLWTLQLNLKPLETMIPDKVSQRVNIEEELTLITRITFNTILLFSFEKGIHYEFYLIIELLLLYILNLRCVKGMKHAPPWHTIYVENMAGAVIQN